MARIIGSTTRPIDTIELWRMILIYLENIPWPIAVSAVQQDLESQGVRFEEGEFNQLLDYMEKTLHFIELIPDQYLKVKITETGLEEIPGRW